LLKLIGRGAVELSCMKQPRRWLFSGLAGASLLLSVATILIWIESEFASDFIYRADSTSQISVAWGAGELALIYNYLPNGGGPSTPEVHFNHANRPRWFSRDAAHSSAQALSLWNRLGFIVLYKVQSASWGGYMSLVSIPAWFLVLTFSALPLARLREGYRLWLRRRSHLCVNCGYDLRATPDRCPECGTIPPKKEIISN
jgi:hypothetical protein